MCHCLSVSQTGVSLSLPTCPEDRAGVYVVLRKRKPAKLEEIDMTMPSAPVDPEVGMMCRPAASGRSKLIQ
jgi:hypothetical protein